MATRKVQMTMYVDEELKQAVEKIAERDDRSLAYTLERLVRNSLKAEKTRVRR